MPSAEAVQSIQGNESPNRLRVKAHSQYVGTPIAAVLSSKKIDGDRPAGDTAINKIRLSSRSPEALQLKSMPGWQDLKFVFPRTWTGKSVMYVSWSKVAEVFIAKPGFVAYPWQPNFRTVHE